MIPKQVSAKRSALAAAMLLTLAVLSACTPGDVEASPTPEVVVTPPEPSPTPTPTVVSIPTPAFGGDCENVIPAADLVTFFGASATASPFLYRRSTPVDTLGGIECAWTGSDADYMVEGVNGPVAMELRVLVVPDRDVPADVRSDYRVPVCEQDYDTGVCSVGVIVEGLWIVASVVNTDGSNFDRPAPGALMRAIDGIVARAPLYAAGAGVTRTETWWAAPDCQSLGERIDIAGLWGIADPVAGSYEAGSPTPRSRVLAGAGVESNCPWFDQETADFLSLGFYAGSAWDWDAVVATWGTATPIDFVGATRAAHVATPWGGQVVVATDGVNLLLVTGTGPPDLLTIAERTLAAID